ncbi:MAG: PQQ-binding-like beta-propeller repeat protein [Acidobacteriota bacterium]
MFDRLTLVLLALLALGVIAAHLLIENNDQNAVMLTIAAGLLAAPLILLWLLLSGPFSWRGRVAVLAVLLAGVWLTPRVLVFRGWTGNLLPLIEWRSSGPGDVVRADGSIVLDDDLRWPGFLGPARRGVSPGPALDPDWDASPPQLLWRRPVGSGWAGFAIAGNAAITLEQHAAEGSNDLARAEQRVVHYALDSGEIVWSHTLTGGFTEALGGPGPRTTPAIADGRVYAADAVGRVVALDLASGDLVWQVDLFATYDAPVPQYAYASSPLLIDDPEQPGERLVVLAAGGPNGHLLVAHDADDGSPRWHGGDGRLGYASPILLTLAGVPQIVSFNAASVTGHDPASGRVLWTHPWTSGTPIASTPLALRGHGLGNDTVLVSSGYGHGTSRLRLRRSPDGAMEVETLWHSRRMKAKFTNLVQYEGSVYGLDDGVFVCLDPETGERRWKRGRYGHGQTVRRGGHLLVQTEDGDVVLLDADPEAHRERGTLAALTSKTWNPLILVGDVLVVRNDREAAAYRLAVHDDSAAPGDAPANEAPADDAATDGLTLTPPAAETARRQPPADGDGDRPDAIG